LPFSTRCCTTEPTHFTAAKFSFTSWSRSNPHSRRLADNPTSLANITSMCRFKKSVASRSSGSTSSSRPLANWASSGPYLCLAPPSRLWLSLAPFTLLAFSCLAAQRLLPRVPARSGSSILSPLFTLAGCHRLALTSKTIRYHLTNRLHSHASSPNFEPMIVSGSQSHFSFPLSLSSSLPGLL
jgi:hypothetical protein